MPRKKAAPPYDWRRNPVRCDLCGLRIGVDWMEPDDRGIRWAVIKKRGTTIMPGARKVTCSRCHTLKGE